MTTTTCSVVAVTAILILSAAGQQNTNVYTEQVGNELTTHTTLLSEEYSKIDEFFEQSNSNADSVCTLCEQVAAHIINYRRAGASRNNVISLLEYVCTHVNQMDIKVCTGLANINIDTYLYIIDNRQNLTAARVCSIYLPAENCYDPQATNWTINIPPKRLTRTIKTHELSSKPLKILHLTDIHYDPNYSPGSNAVCVEELCCEWDSTQTPNATKIPAGYWGDYHVCDMPWHSIENMFDNIEHNHRDVDFVYYTGDIISHRVWTTNQENNTKTISKTFRRMSSAFGSTKVYSVLGNHEAHPVDQWPPENLANTSLTVNWLFELAGQEWSEWLSKEAIATIQKGGFYTDLVKPGFRVIGLNTNVAFTKNVWLIYDDIDPYSQLQWMVDTLLKAEENGEIVHILSHVPPGTSYGSTYGVWMHQYRRIIERFAHIIPAQFNGHTHEDELKIFYNSTNPEQVVNVAFNGGSVTPFVGNNPDYRVYKVNPNTYEVLDYDEWIYNLTEANLNPNKPPRWYKLYSFKEAYGMSDLSLKSFGELLQNMARNRSILEQYFRFYVRESDALLHEGCDDACLTKLLCDITQVDFEENLQCTKFKEIFMKQQ